MVANQKVINWVIYPKKNELKLIFSFWRNIFAKQEKQTFKSWIMPIILVWMESTKEKEKLIHDSSWLHLSLNDQNKMNSDSFNVISLNFFFFWIQTINLRRIIVHFFGLYFEWHAAFVICEKKRRKYIQNGSGTNRNSDATPVMSRHWEFLFS